VVHLLVDQEQVQVVLEQQIEEWVLVEQVLLVDQE
tara:strand:+ start:370 stop:474 length:105 start_codon:yes stop_codon:yes gene_type:complete